MELETINKLYLELSQIATATTAREAELYVKINEQDGIIKQAQAWDRRMANLLHEIHKDDSITDGLSAVAAAINEYNHRKHELRAETSERIAFERGNGVLKDVLLSARLLISNIRDRAPGYDWNADKSEFTLLISNIFERIDRLIRPDGNENTEASHRTTKAE